jgi:uncharacterized protein (DUF58 family)
MPFLKIAGFVLLLTAFLCSFIFAEFIPLPMAVLAIFRLLIGLVVISVYMKNVFLPTRFFITYGAVILSFIFAFFFENLAFVAQTTLATFGAFLAFEFFFLFNGLIKLNAKRILPKFFSLGDDNLVKIDISHQFVFPLSIEIIDELPVQFQKRDFSMFLSLGRRESKQVVYPLKPFNRGEYHFNDLHCFVRSFLGLIERKITFDNAQFVPVYPSVIQMKKFALMTLSQIASMRGVKKVRRIGHSYEFEQIRNYVKGDDYRSVNWKATSRRNSLMVNQYEDERSQQIFCVIDKGRSMEMPFGGMSLLDYAVNASLVILNIALQKHDKAGLLTFSDKIGATVKAESGAGHLKTILETLYNEQSRNYEANYELFYTATKQFVNRRSLMFLYTNFESYSAMQRVLPILRKISRFHLLVVVFFENTEILDFARTPALNTEDIYYRTIANRFVAEKQRIVQELNQLGIQAILSRPEDLSLNTVNKYLELKAKAAI